LYCKAVKKSKFHYKMSKMRYFHKILLLTYNFGDLNLLDLPKLWPFQKDYDEMEL